MSYYNCSKYIVTYHAIQRARERLKFSGEEWEVINRIKNEIENSHYSFSDNKNTTYFESSKKDYYFVVAYDNTVITVSKLSWNKIIELMR